LLRETFPKFELIKTIELRENERGEKHYRINYELSDGTFVVLVLALVLLYMFKKSKEKLKRPKILRESQESGQTV